MNGHLLIGILIALVYFSFGMFMLRKAGYPSKILGYRSSKARKNMDTWMEANHYAGRMIMVTGLILILLLLIYIKIFPVPIHFYTAMSSTLIGETLIVFLLTEWHLSKVFYKDGKRRPYF
jgi:uncharacterized membrane protein